jgi:hypothetical protein
MTAQVTKLVDSGSTAIISITDRFTGSSDYSTIILDPTTLNFANTSQYCGVNITRIQYSVSIASGYVNLYWDGATPSDIANYGKIQSGDERIYIKNTAITPTGSIGLAVINSQDTDAYTIILELDKAYGYMSAYGDYQVYPPSP